MPIIRLLVLCGVSFGAAGCAMHPLPHDVTGYDTSVIVQKIRCEMRDAIRQAIVRKLQDTDAMDAQDRRVMSDEDAAVARELAAEPRRFEGEAFRPLFARLSPDAKNLLRNYDQGGIAYEFKFDITESNKVKGGLGFLEPLAGRTLTLGFKTESDWQRQNERTFRLVDEAKGLVTSPMNGHCSDARGHGTAMYPITGSIGLDELVWTFYTLNENVTLKPTGENPVPTLSDTFTFTTTVSAGVAPSVSLDPVGRGFRVGTFEAEASAKRHDVHEVKIVLTLPLDKTASPADKTKPAVVSPRVVLRAPRSRALTEPQQRALDELDRQELLDNSLGRRDLRLLQQFLRDNQ